MATDDTTTDKPARSPRNSRIFGAGEAFDRLMKVRDGRAAARAEWLEAAAQAFDKRELATEAAIAGRCDQPDRLKIMLAALPLAELDAISVIVERAYEDKPDAAPESDAVPERLREPLSPSRLAMGRTR